VMTAMSDDAGLPSAWTILPTISTSV
jgi:hypothetical protein